MKIEFETDPDTVKHIVYNLKSLMRSIKYSGLPISKVKVESLNKAIEQISSQIKYNKDEVPDIYVEIYKER